jgi:hypothetical protein
MNLKLWDEVIDNLRGTASSPSDLGEEVEELFNNLEFCNHLDDQIFKCECCGWWCEIDEEASEEADLDELTCRQCVEELQ